MKLMIETALMTSLVLATVAWCWMDARREAREE
jgi:hypothetical protein